MKNSVFGHLAQKFSTHPENLATEALAFVLRRSEIATRALVRFFQSTGAVIDGDLHFLTQAFGSDSAIPDLVGIGVDNSQVVICEAKFWAGLTDNQPVTYLNRRPKLLIFVAPAKRLQTLWFELGSRCNMAGIKLNPCSISEDELVVAKVANDDRLLAVASWRVILDTLQSELTSHGDAESVSDIEQLRGLCDQMDSVAFLPIRSEEMSPSIPIRIMQFNDVVDELTDKLVSAGIASIEGFRSTPIRDGYLRYMQVREFGWALQVNFRHWSSLRETPIWLDVQNRPPQGSWEYSPEARDRLGALEREFPSRLIRSSNSLYIPLRVPFGVEKNKVVDAVFNQLLEINNLLLGSRSVAESQVMTG